jgi:outer membrane protein with beta-barrel domain
MDKFNDIWKNRFNDGDTPVGDWNTPDQVVWESILPHVAPQKRDRTLVFWLLGILLIGLLFLGYFTLIHYNKKHALNTDLPFTTTIKDDILVNTEVEKEYNIQHIGKEIENEKSSNTAEISTSLANKKEIITRVKKGRSVPVHMEKGKELHANKTSKSNKAAPHLKSELVVDRINESTININAEKFNMEKEGFLNIEKDQIDKSKNITDLALLPNKKLEILNFNKKEVLPQKVKSEFSGNVKSKNIVFGIRTGVEFLQHKISASYQSDLAPFDFNYTDNAGWFTAVDVQVPLNKFLDITGSIQYESVETSSGHNSNLAYSISDEENSNSNDYTLNLATPYGLSEAKFRFNRNEDIGTDEVDLLVDFHSQHTLRNLTLPIGIKIYPLGKRQRYIPFAKIGFGTNYLFDISNSIQSIDTHHDAITYTSKGSSDFESPNLNNWHFDLQLGLGFGYYITNKFQLNLYYNWSRGLNPVFEQGNYQTRLDRHYLSIGLLNTF